MGPQFDEPVLQDGSLLDEKDIPHLSLVDAVMHAPLSTRPSKTKMESTASLQTASDVPEDTRKNDGGGEWSTALVLYALNTQVQPLGGRGGGGVEYSPCVMCTQHTSTALGR